MDYRAQKERNAYSHLIISAPLDTERVFFIKGLALRAYTLSPSTSPFWEGFFKR
jgi:hypothetical protein